LCAETRVRSRMRLGVREDVGRFARLHDVSDREEIRRVQRKVRRGDRLGKLADDCGDVRSCRIQPRSQRTVAAERAERPLNLGKLIARLLKKRRRFLA
jgi:hypothetical protein